MKSVWAWILAKMPTRESMERNRYMRPIAHRFLRSELWRFTRRSVPRGVALGMFAAFIIPLGQIFLAAFLAPALRANVPVAALTTFITNPLTIGLWGILANKTGKFILQIDSMTFGEPLNTQMRSTLGEWVNWLFLQTGVTAFGFAFLAIVSATLGYVISSFGWRYWIAHKRRRSQVLLRRSV
ncbi:DUF2062 domain-containing protein [Alterisphingorhabdus coralli]|uniref:DUF2062 domain-containing protein n=1 Tax=Alterisphingorhabdus coralli TaxID=3071408 RepID=A0AA97F731_9SPHN|nr:DUF2062 domain-containing protein [Parasphingorhabdus sp. SCSIO 66989]WOE74468.1 DUF2062 domain-containing protein [Parasphingorhabdus sp. SCSIO 66989]